MILQFYADLLNWWNGSLWVFSCPVLLGNKDPVSQWLRTSESRDWLMVNSDCKQLSCYFKLSDFPITDIPSRNYPPTQTYIKGNCIINVLWVTLLMAFNVICHLNQPWQEHFVFHHKSQHNNDRYCSVHKFIHVYFINPMLMIMIMMVLMTKATMTMNI